MNRITLTTGPAFLKAATILAFMLLTPPPTAAQVSLSLNRMIYVSAVGTPTENCQAVMDVMDGIVASATNRYLVKLEPGVYDCDFTQIMMKEFVSLEGAGAATLIRGRNFTVVELASNTELRSVKVENYDDICNETFYAISAFQGEVVNARVVDVVAESVACKFGIAYFGGGIGSSSTVISHSTLRGDAGSLHLHNSQQIACDFSILDGDIVEIVAGPTTACVVCTDATQLRNPDCTAP